MSEKIYDPLGAPCEHDSCIDYGGRDIYCGESGEDSEGDAMVLVDRLESLMLQNIAEADSGVDHSTGPEGTYTARDFQFFSRDAGSDGWPLTEKSVNITREYTRQPSELTFFVTVGWKVHQQVSSRYGSNQTEYLIKIDDHGVEATIFEPDLRPEDATSPGIRLDHNQRTITPYDYEVLFGALEEIAGMQAADRHERQVIGQL